MPIGCRNIEPVHLGAHSISSEEELSSVSLTVSNNTIVGALLQLSSLVRHADDLFCDISDECQLVVERTDKLCKKIAKINAAAAKLDAKRVQVPEGDLKKFSAIADHHRARHGYDTHFFLPTNRPQCVHDQYNLCMPNPGRAIRSADLYRKDGLSGSKMFKCWPVIYNDQAVRTPDLSLPRRIQRVRSFERKYKKLRERPKTIHGWDDFKLEDKKKEGAEDECLKPSEPPVVVSIDTSGSNFERMQSLRLSGRRYQKREEREKKKRRRRTVTGVPENILHEIERFDRQKRHEDGPRHTPRSYSFDDLDMEDDIERDEAMVKYLDEIDGKIEERMAEEKAQKLMKFFPCRRSRSLPRCIKLGSVTRSLSVERNKNNHRDVDRDLNTSYGSSSLSLTSAVSSASSRLSRATKRSSALGSKLKSLMSGNTKDKPRQRPKSLDIDTVLDTNTGTNQIKSQERSKSTYSLERNREARSVPDSLLRQEFSEGSSSTVGPGTYYNFESSTLPRAQQKKYDFPWESLPKDWTTSVKLREISKRRAKEDRQSSSGNWSQSGTSSNRHSLDSDLRSSEGVKFNSQYSLGKDSGRDSLTLEEENDGGTDTTSTAGYAADGTSTIVGSSDSLSIGNPKSDFTQVETEKWLQSLAARAAKQEGLSTHDSLSLSRLTRKNILALDLMLSDDAVTQKRGDEESSVYSVDQEGFYTSFHNDSGLRKSTNTLVDEEGCSPTKDSNSVCSGDSVIFRPCINDKYANLRKGNSQTKVLSKVAPPVPPVRTTSKDSPGEVTNIETTSIKTSPPELHSFSSQDSSVSSVSESDTEAVFSRVQDKTVLSSTGFPSLVALSTSDDESSLEFGGLKSSRKVRKGDNYIFDENEAVGSQPSIYTKFSPGQDNRSGLTSSQSESNFLQFVNTSSERLGTLNEEEQNHSEHKSVTYQSWPRTHKSSTPSGILKTPEKQFDNRPHKTLNFAPMVNLFNPGAQNSVQMPLPSPTNSSSSESNVNSFGLLNGSAFQTPQDKYQLTVPVHENSKLKKKVDTQEILPMKYQPVITVTPKSRSGDQRGSDRDRQRSANGYIDRSPVYASTTNHPKAQSTPHSAGPATNKSRSPSLYAVSPVQSSRDTQRQTSNTSTSSGNSEYMDMQSVSSLRSAESVTSLGSAEGVSLGDNSTYMSMSSPCSSPNLSNMDFSISSTPSGSVDSLLDLRKTPTNELENDTYRVNTNLHMNKAYSGQNGHISNGPTRSSSGSLRNGNISHHNNSANHSINSYRSSSVRNSSRNSDNQSLHSSSSENDLTHVTQMSLNSTRSSKGSPAVSNQSTQQPNSDRRRSGGHTTRHEPSYRSHNASNRRSLPSDMSAVIKKVPLNDMKGKSSTPPHKSSQMSSSRSYPSGFTNMAGQGHVNGDVTRNKHAAQPSPADNYSSRSDSYRVAMDMGGNNNRSGSYRVAMHSSKSFPLLPPTTRSGPYRVAMDMSPKASLNNSFSSDNDDVMSRADSYRIAVRNTNGIVSQQDMNNRNSSYRVAVGDDAPATVNSKFEAMNLDSRKKSLTGRDSRRMGITDVDQAKDVSVSKSAPNGKVSQPQTQSSSRIRKVTQQDVDPIMVVQTVDHHNIDTKKSQKNNQNRSSTYIQFDPIFEDDDFGNPADTLHMLATKAEAGDLSSKDYSTSLSNASKAKYGMISGGIMRDANSNDIKSAKRGKSSHINSGVEIEDNWRFSQV